VVTFAEQRDEGPSVGCGENHVMQGVPTILHLHPNTPLMDAGRAGPGLRVAQGDANGTQRARRGGSYRRTDKGRDGRLMHAGLQLNCGHARGVDPMVQAPSLAQAVHRIQAPPARPQPNSTAPRAAHASQVRLAVAAGVCTLSHTPIEAQTTASTKNGQAAGMRHDASAAVPRQVVVGARGEPSSHARQKQVVIASTTFRSSSTTAIQRHRSKVAQGCEIPSATRSPTRSPAASPPSRR